MRQGKRIAPATAWRAFCFSLAVGTTAFAAQPSAPPELAQFGKPDAAEAARLVEGVRQAGIAGQYFLEFELRSMPLRGEEKIFKGVLWGARNNQGVVMRIELIDASGATQRFLLQNGEQAAVTRWAAGRAAPLDPKELLAPLLPEIDVSAFDLQMPYLYWPNPFVEKITRSVLGRPANVFVFKAPPDFAVQHPEIGSVRANLDTQYNAIIQTELVGPNAKVLKSFALQSIKRLGDQAVPKQVDYRNEQTRNKTRLQVTGAALRLSLPPEVFTAAGLAQPAARPAADKVVRIDP